MENRSKKKNPTLKIILILFLIAAVLAFINAYRTAYNKKAAAEAFEQPDFNSMQEYSAENTQAVMEALKSGKAGKLEKLMITGEGAEDVIAFAEWDKADFENAVSLGAGSLSAAPDENGRMDISERIFVNIGDVRYVLFIETVTSRWGMNNDGVSAVGVTTFSHFDGVDYNWCGEKDDQSALAGELFWDK
ncbi:MAG: hypothetical protein IJ227_00415 [Mogibacterium sp.]|nr:hypothetical protein [Mogibacterium sp.]